MTNIWKDLGKDKKRWITGAILSALLSGCGGGGSSADSTGDGPALGGVAAVGSPIVNGSISARCSAGAPLSTTTNSSGVWQVSLSSEHVLPCAVQVSGGTVGQVSSGTSYHSIATTDGVVNVTPLTDLMVANLAGTATPDLWFDGLSTNSGQLTTITQSDIDATLAKLRVALNGLIPLDSVDPITITFAATEGDAGDDMLTALRNAMTDRGITYTALLTNASATDFVAPVTDFDLDLASAFMGTSSGGGTPTTPGMASFSGTYTLTTDTGTTATIAVDNSGNVTSCHLDTIVLCSGKLVLNSTTNTASFKISGNDGLNPVDTRATVSGTIDAAGNVTGSYTGNSVADGPFGGTLDGTRSVQYAYIPGYANAAAQAGDALPGLIQIQRTDADPCVTPPAAPTGLQVTKRQGSYLFNDFYFEPVMPGKYPDYIHYEVRKSTIDPAVSSDAMAGLRLFVNGGYEVDSGGAGYTAYEYFAVQAINSCGLRSPMSSTVRSFAVDTGAPAIMSVSPGSGPVGTVVTITGSNFSTTVADNMVEFNGVSAAVASATATTITVAVPNGATTGTVSVTTAGGTATSSGNFTVTSGGATPSSSTLTITGSVSLSPVMSPDTGLDIDATGTISGTTFMYDGSSLLVDANEAHGRTWVTADGVTSFFMSVDEDTTTNTLIVSVTGAGASIAEGYYVGTSLSASGDCGIGAVPSCAGAGITLDRTAGTLTFANTPMIRRDIMGSAGLLGTITVNGTLSFTPF